MGARLTAPLSSLKLDPINNVPLLPIINGAVAGESILSGSLWNDSPVLLMVIRRPG